MPRTRGLAVIETHPVQYHAPVYRVLQERFGIDVTAIYGSDFSIVGYRDQEFETTFSWDTDLLSGYRPIFLSQVTRGGARTADEVNVGGLDKVLRRISPAACLLTGYSPRFHLQAFACAWRSGSPLLFRGETTDHARVRNRGKKWSRDLLLRWIYSRCSALLYVGQRSYEHYRRLGCSKDQLAFSPYCVDITSFRVEERDRDSLRCQTRQALKITDEQHVILFSGKLVQRKAPDLLLQAVKHLPPDVRDRLTVIFLGDGSLRKELLQFAREIPSIETRFEGFQNQQALSKYFHASDVLVLPSREQETWGLVVNEALHHGLPCVVSDQVGCAPDLVEPGATGEIFESGSAFSLGQAIERALKLSGRVDTRHQCRLKVSDYTVERAAAGIASAYYAVTAGTTPSNTNPR